jgi:hypothetical protein
MFLQIALLQRVVANGSTEHFKHRCNHPGIQLVFLQNVPCSGIPFLEFLIFSGRDPQSSLLIKQTENSRLDKGPRRVWRYQRGNQNPYIEEEQTTPWPIEKAQRDRQRSTKHTYKTKDRLTRTIYGFWLPLWYLQTLLGPLSRREFSVCLINRLDTPTF